MDFYLNLYKPVAKIIGTPALKRYLFGTLDLPIRRPFDQGFGTDLLRVTVQTVKSVKKHVNTHSI